MAGRSGHRGESLAPPEGARQRNGDVFWPWSISSHSQSTIAPAKAGISVGSAGYLTQFSRRLARAAAQCGSTSRHSPWSKPVDHLQNAAEQTARHSDLHRHEYIVFTPLAPRVRWRWRSRGRALEISVRGRLVVNSIPLAIEAAVRGLGIARPPGAREIEGRAADQLAEVLDAYAPPARPL
jgi:hypothetical protein